MKLTRVVTMAIMYDVENGEPYTRMCIGRVSRRKAEANSTDKCVEVKSVKAVVTIPDEIVEQYATIEVINDSVAPATEVKNVKAVVTIPDKIVEQYATIEVINDSAAPATEVAEND